MVASKRRFNPNLQRVRIDDDGPGIPAPDRQRVFEPFTRLDASRNRMSGGYGLGLAIVTRICLLSGDQASVDLVKSTPLDWESCRASRFSPNGLSTKSNTQIPGRVGFNAPAMVASGWSGTM